MRRNEAGIITVKGERNYFLFFVLKLFHCVSRVSHVDVRKSTIKQGKSVTSCQRTLFSPRLSFWIPNFGAKMYATAPVISCCVCVYCKCKHPYLVLLLYAGVVLEQLFFFVMSIIKSSFGYSNPHA